MAERAGSIAVFTVAAGIVFTLSPANAAPLIQTYAQTIAGQSSGPVNCSTFQTPAAVSGFFGSGVFVPVGGNAVCGVAEDVHTSISASGSLSDTASLSTSFNGGLNAFSGTASGNAQPGKVGAEAHGTFTGGQNSTIVDGAQAFGLFRDTYTATSAAVASGTPGTAFFTISLDGSLATTNANPAVTTSDVEVLYQVDTGPVFTLFRSQANNSSSAPFLTAPTTPGNPVGGFVVTPGAIAGSGTFQTFQFGFVWGQAFDFALGLLAYVIPGTDGTGDVDFSSTALLSGITLGVASTGQSVSNFDIVSGSGAAYDATGVLLASTAVAEPAAFGLFGLGLVGLGIAARRRKTA